MAESVADIVLRSIAISGSATIIATSWSIPLAYYMTKSPRLSKAIAPIAEALVGVPTVLVGLLLYLLLSSRGPLGFAGLLYTPYGIMAGQAILITPLITSVSYRVLQHAKNTYGELAISLGASESQAMGLMVRESLPGVIASLVMGFSRALGELGIALMVGGNIKGYTRVMTTAIALEVARGEFGLAVALGAVLVFIVISASASLRYLQRLQEV